MKDIKVNLVDVEDESVYNKPDWTVLAAVGVMVVLCGIIYGVMSVIS